MRPQDGSVSDAFGNDVAGEFALTLGMPVELGGIAIAVDHVDAPWPDQEALVPMAKPAAAAAPPEAAPPAQGDAASAMATPKQRLLAWRPSRRLSFAVGGAVLTLVVSLATLLGEGGTSSEALAAAPPPPAEPAPPLEPPPELKQLLSMLDAASSVTLSAQPDGRWLVAGYLPTIDKREALARGLEALALPYTMEVHADEALADAAGKVIDEHDEVGGAVLRVKEVHGGHVRLVGAVSHATSLERIRQALLDAVPGVLRVEGDVVMRADLLSQLKDRIVSAGLDRQLTIVKEWPEVVLSGRLSGAERVRWDEVLSAFQAEYGKLLPVQAALAPPEKAAIEVSFVVGGPAPYVVTSQGVRVNRGGELDGHRLTTVSDSEVVFEGPERLRIAR